MNQRERLLAAGVGLLILILGIFFVWSRAAAPFAERQRTIEKLRSDLDRNKASLRKIERAQRAIDEYAQRSLPADAETAKAGYQRWLLQLVDPSQDAGLEDPQVTAVPAAQRGDAFQILAFNIKATGNLQDLVEFLYHFYGVDVLHRIRLLQIKPIEGTKQLDLTMTVEAVVMKESTTTDDWAVRRAIAPRPRLLEDYYDVILERNLFAPGNQAPELRSIGTQRAECDRSFSFSAEAKDADPLDRLTFSLAGDVPEGAEIHPKTGLFSWRPREPGLYRFAVRVADDGIPMRADVETVEIRVEEPPAPEPERVVEKPPPKPFDHSQHTFLTAIISVDGRPQAWFHVRTTDEQLRLFEGDEIQVGTVSGRIAKIEPRSVEIATDEALLVVPLGQSLGKVEPATAAAGQ